jgi:predicted transport protein
MVEFERAERLSLRAHPALTEKWVQDRIADDPSILGLGELELRQKERIQPRAGRLDLLLQDPDTKRRYEVELQLGATDETHIIRTIEYWDIERKRYPQYDHCAVLIAEDITSRFLNVIALFNGTIPLIALQMQALKLGGKTTIIFTRVMDEMARGLVDEDEETAAFPADRSYWEGKGSKSTLELVDKCLKIINELDSSLDLKYNKHYIGLGRDGIPCNFVSFIPKKSTLTIEFKIPQSDDVDAIIDAAGLDKLEYGARWNLYRLRITSADLKSNESVLAQLVKLAHDRRASV